MKYNLKKKFLQLWNQIFTKLSTPIAPKTTFFSQESAQLVFILLVFIMISDTSNAIEFSQTISGHIFAVFILIFFTLIHPMIGAILSMMMILYYHTDLIKAYYYDSIFYKNIPSTIQEQFVDLEPHVEYIDTTNKMESSTINSAYPFTKDVQTISSKYSPWFRPSFFNEFEIREGFGSPSSSTTTTDNHPIYLSNKSYSNYQSTFDEPINHFSIPMTETDSKYAEEEAQLNALFRHERCNSNGQLIYKDSVVKPIMAEHVFPELQIEGSQNGHVCNPCHMNCAIHISKIDQRLNNERILQQRNQPSLQKTSSDWIPTWFDIFLPHPVFQPDNNPNTQPFPKPANL